MTTQKTYTQIREETDIEALNEFRVLRSGAVLVFASKVREQGRKIEQHMNAAQTKFTYAKKADDINEKINLFIDGLDEMAQGITDMRFVMGNMTGISVSSALLAERSNKEIQKIIRKGKR